jgi:hypothetical protein
MIQLRARDYLEHFARPNYQITQLPNYSITRC